MSNATEAALAEARAEVETLRSENVRLRDLLGLNTCEADGHRQAWAPTLFTQSAASATIDSASPQDDKLALLRSLFGARTDIHALRWESASAGYDCDVTNAAETLLEQALTLPAEDRVLLASGLLASLDSEALDEAEVERLWSVETERRAAQLESGDAELVTWEQLLQRIDERRS